MAVAQLPARTRNYTVDNGMRGDTKNIYDTITSLFVLNTMENQR